MKRIISFIGAIAVIAQIWVLISVFFDGLQISWGTTFIPLYVLLLCGWAIGDQKKD